MKKNEEDEKKTQEKYIYQPDFSKYQQFIDETVLILNTEIQKFNLNGLYSSKC